MTIGLDLGSSQFRSMWTDGQNLVARRCPALYVTITDTPAHRRLLQQSNTRFASCSEYLLVFGDAAVEWSAMLNLPTTPLLRGGYIPAADSIARQILTIIIDGMLPRPAEAGTLCRMTLPGSGMDDRVASRDADFFQQLVALRGYRPKLITATQALALAELNDAAFSGTAVTIGHSTCEFGVVHCGREVVRCVILNGMESFEGAPRLDVEHLDGTLTTVNLEREYTRFFKELIQEAKAHFEEDRTIRTLPGSMPVVCTGGITGAPSFLRLFQEAWNGSEWPVPTGPIRVASDPDLSVVRGCLIQAELDEPSLRDVA